MKKILLFAHDPGGANVVAPLFFPLKRNGFNVVLFGIGPALERYRIIGVEGEDISKELENRNFEKVFEFISKQHPNLVITGTSAEDFTEKYTWKSCEKLNIPCFAILDQWMNYGVRFSKYKISELSLYDAYKNHDFLPSKICVMDEIAKQKTIQERISERKIIITGHPYFDWVSKNTLKFNNLNNATKKVLFISEPISQGYGNYLGYTEKTIFGELIHCLEKISLIYHSGIFLHQSLQQE